MDKHDMRALLKIQEDIEKDPNNAAQPGLIYRFTPAARKKLANVQAAIAHKLAENRADAGRPVPVEGYSGRKSNRK